MLIGRNVSAERRSWAMGIAAAAGSFGQFLMVPVEGMLINFTGWQNALLILAAAALAPGLETRAEFAKQLDDHVAVAQAVEGQALVGQGRLFGQGDHGLDHTAQFLGLGQRGLDDFVLNQRVHHVAQHRQAVLAGAVEFAKSVSVTHGVSFRCFAGRRIRYGQGTDVLF